MQSAVLNIFYNLHILLFLIELTVYVPWDVPSLSHPHWHNAVYAELRMQFVHFTTADGVQCVRPSGRPLSLAFSKNTHMHYMFLAHM